MTKEEASQKLSNMVTVAENAVSQCEEFAKEHGLEFTFSPAYGMGGTFYGVVPEYITKWHGMSESGWLSSSSTC